MPHNPHRSSDMKLSSLLFLGDLCPLFYKKPLHYVKVVHEHYWETVLKEFWVGEKKLCCDVLPGYVIFDSGTSFNTLPANYYQFFFDLLDPLLVSNSVNSLKEFPTLRYVLVIFYLLF
jgi:pepsin A